MAFFKSLLCPLGTPQCHQVSIQIMKNKCTSLKILKLNLNNRTFTTSTNKSVRWKKTNNNNNTTAKSFAKLDTLGGTENIEPPPFTIGLLFKPFLFTVAFSSVSLAGTAIWQYENIRKKAMSIINKTWLSEKIFGYEKKKDVWRKELKKIWNQLSEGEKLFVPICLANILIYLAWKVKKFQPTMIKYFCSSPFGEAVCWPMVLSTFSHYNLFHLIINMYVLYGFSTTAVEVLGKEQFLGLYLTAGVVSSFTSYFNRALRSQHSLSIGASGAIMAVIAYICAKNPESKLSIIFLPGFVFSAGSGLKMLMGLDTLGVLRGWKFFDHAAHLGGALCGVGWCLWGNTYIWQKREPLLHWWHEIRTASK